MKLPIPTPGEIYEIANRASGNIVSARSVNTLIIENAIRTALNSIVERLNIQVSNLYLNLDKD